MKTKLIGVLVFSMLVAACGQTATDVGVTTSRGGGGAGGGGDGGLVPPDSTIKGANSVTRIYGPGHSFAIHNGLDEVTSDALRPVVDRVEALGYTFDADATAVATATLADGRRVVATWLAFGDPSGGSTAGQVIDLRTPDGDFAAPVRIDPALSTGFAVLPMEAKGESRGDMFMLWPWWYLSCVNQAIAAAVEAYRAGADLGQCASVAIYVLMQCLNYATL